MSDTSLNGILFLNNDLTRQLATRSLINLKETIPGLKFSNSIEILSFEFSTPLSILDKPRKRYLCNLSVDGFKFGYQNNRAIKGFHFVERGERQAILSVWSDGNTFQRFIDNAGLGKRFMYVYGTLAASIGAYFGFLGHEFQIYSPSDDFEIDGINYIVELMEHGRYSNFFLSKDLVDRLNLSHLAKWASIVVNIGNDGVVVSNGDTPFVGGVDPNDEFYRNHLLPTIFNRLNIEYIQNPSSP